MKDSAYFADKEKPKCIMFQSPFYIRDVSPIEIIHRDEQLSVLSNAINSLNVSNLPENLFIYGPSGTGKTACVKQILSRSEIWPKIVPVYVDCHECTTKTALFNKIAFKLGNPVSRRGFASYEVFERINELLRKGGKTILLVLDNFEYIQNGAPSELLYPLLSTFNGGLALFAIIVIASDLGAIERLDEKIKGSFLFRAIAFEPYSRNQLADILDVLTKRTIAPNSIKSGVIQRIAELGESEGGNARFAVRLLLSSAKRAEQRGAEEIEIEDVDAIYESLAPIHSNISVTEFQGLSKEELLIIGILQTGKKPSSDIYETFQKNIELSKRQVRNYLVALEKKGIIESEISDNSTSILKPKIFKLVKGGANGVSE